MIKFASIFFIFACGASVALANGDISQFVFTTDPQTIKPNEISGELTIHYSSSEKTDATTTETIDLEFLSDSTSGEFLNKTGSPASAIMNKGTANRTFYYRDSASGAYLITVKMKGRDSGKSWMASQKITVLSNAEQPNGSLQASSSSSSSSSQNSSAISSFSAQNIVSGSVNYNYKNEQISAKAGEDKTAVAGADIVLEGNALGFKKEPLENARYLWVLGDGSYKEGKNIRHVYKYPGNYIAVLDVSSGDVSASDRINVKVISNELQIIDVKDEFIKLKNKSGIILDISGWFLRADSANGGTVFKFPDYSLIAANSELVISSDISDLKFADNKFPAELLYPNGSVAFSYSPSSSLKPKETVLSKPPEKKAEIATAQVISTKNYSSAGSSSISPASSADKSQNFAVKKNPPVGEAGLASVIMIGDKNNSGSKIWLILAVITGIIGGAGVFLVRRSGNNKENKANNQEEKTKDINNF